jgi:hypothetical protein
MEGDPEIESLCFKLLYLILEMDLETIQGSRRSIESKRYEKGS